MTLHDQLLHHAPSRLGLVRDFTDDDSPESIEVLVASGDCFVTLASLLDAASELAKKDLDTAILPLLERITRTLIYLQRYYEVDRKKR